LRGGKSFFLRAVLLHLLGVLTPPLMSNLQNIELRYAVKRHDAKWSPLGASFCFYFHSLAAHVFGCPLSSQSLHMFSTTHRPAIPYDSRCQYARFSPPARRSSIGFWRSFLGVGMGRRLTRMQDIIEIRPLSLLCCSPSTPPSAETAHRAPLSDRCLPERFLAARFIRLRSQAFLIQVVRFHGQGKRGMPPEASLTIGFFFRFLLGVELGASCRNFVG
jgi:hypothetical protein